VRIAPNAIKSRLTATPIAPSTDDRPIRLRA
jgi:hypothetical protein